MLLKTFVLLLMYIYNISCSGRCGPEYYAPEKSEDCIDYSTNDSACCMISMRDAPAEFRICYLMNLTDVTPIISIGKLSYEVDCSAMENFTQIFPLEGKYTSCGVQNPLSPGDCWPFTTGLGACCMTGISEIMNGDNDPFCYYFPEAKFEKKNFTVDTNVDGLKYYVSCWCNYIKINFVMVILISFIMF